MIAFILIFGLVMMYMAPKAYKIFANMVKMAFGKSKGKGSNKLIIRLIGFALLIFVSVSYFGNFGLFGAMILVIGILMKKRR